MPEAATVEANVEQAGTQTEEFDPTLGNPSTETEVTQDPPEGGDSKVTAKLGQPEKKPDLKPEAGEEQDPAEEALTYYEQLAGTKKSGTETQSDDNLAPDKLKAEIESSTQDPQERFDKLLSRVGGITNELGTLRKENTAHQALVSELDKLTVAGPDGRLVFDAGAVLQKMIGDYGVQAVREQLAAANLAELLPASTPAAAIDEDAIVAEVAKASNLNIEGLNADQVLELVQSDPRAALRLQRKFREIEMQQRDAASRKEATSQQQRQREVSEVRSAVAELEKSIPHFAELAPVMETLHGQLPKDRPLVGGQRVAVLRALAEASRFPAVLKDVAGKVRVQEQARLTKALLALGWKKEQAEKLFATKLAAKPVAPRSPVPAKKGIEDGSWDSWT